MNTSLYYKHVYLQKIFCFFLVVIGTHAVEILFLAIPFKQHFSISSHHINTKCVNEGVKYS